MPHRRLVGTLAAVITMVAACPPGASAGASTSEATTLEQGIFATAPAARFTDSVGVATHWGYTDTPYSSAYDRVKRALVDSGIKHVRGRAFRAADLYQHGIHSTVVIDRLNNAQDPATQVAALGPLARSGAVVAVEGPNEPDVFWTKNQLSYRGRAFPEGVVSFQRDLHAAVKGDPETAGLDVIGPSLGRRYWSGGMPFAPGTFSRTADFGNFHPYPMRNSTAPSSAYAGLSKYYWQADFPSITLDRYPIDLTTHRAPFGGRAMMATETGYPTWRGGQSEKMHGRYMPRLFLENFRLGIQRTYAYELLDEFDDPGKVDREANFGLLRHDLTPKPAFYAMRSLLGALEDPGAQDGSAGPGAPSATAGLAATLEIAPPRGFDAQYLHHVALQKTDGTVVLALWHEVSGNDLSGVGEDPPRPVLEVEQPAVPVVLDLGARADGAVIETIGDDGRLRPTPADRTGSAYGFSVPDRVTLVTVPPAGGTASETDEQPDLRRVAGADREGTAIAVARDRFDAGVPGVVLASRSSFADSLAGAPLAQQVGGPLLLTSSRRLDDRVAAELSSLVRTGGTVYLLGGRDAVSDEVQAAVEQLGLVVRRLAGPDRYATAVAIAEEVEPGAGGCDVLLVTGRNFADGASAAGQAAPQQPILYSDGTEMPEVTLQAIRGCVEEEGRGGELTAVGGPAATAAGTAEPTLDGIDVRSVVGEDRYATAALLLLQDDSAAAGTVVLSSGSDFPDALIGGTYGYPLLLTRPDQLPDSVRAALTARNRQVDELIVVGGPSSVSTRTAEAAAAATD